MYNLLPLLPVHTYLDSDEFEAGICERNVYLLKNKNEVLIGPVKYLSVEKAEN